MPQIIGQQAQQAALKEIKAALKEMESTNDFLDHQNDTGKYTILFTSTDGARCRAVAHVDKREEIDRLVLHHKQLVSEHVVALATAHRIALDIDEKLILNLELSPEEQDELESRALAELEEAEQAAAAGISSVTEEESPESNTPADAPFYPTEDDIQ